MEDKKSRNNFKKHICIAQTLAHNDKQYVTRQQDWNKKKLYKTRQRQTEVCSAFFLIERKFPFSLNL